MENTAVDPKEGADTPVSDPVPVGGILISEEFRLRVLRTVGMVFRTLAKIDADYLPGRDQKRLESVIEGLIDLETQLAPAPVQLTPGVALSAQERLVLVHIRRRGRIMRSDLRRALSRYRINSAALSAAVGTLIRAGIVSERRELASNGHMKTTYSVAPKRPHDE
jgi:hypothetical protein